MMPHYAMMPANDGTHSTTHPLPSTPPTIAYKNALLAAPSEARHPTLNTDYPPKSPIQVPTCSNNLRKI
jgi:hypothetical protein